MNVELQRVAIFNPLASGLPTALIVIESTKRVGIDSATKRATHFLNGLMLPSRIVVEMSIEIFRP